MTWKLQCCVTIVPKKGQRRRSFGKTSVRTKLSEEEEKEKKIKKISSYARIRPGKLLELDKLSTCWLGNFGGVYVKCIMYLRKVERKGRKANSRW